MWNFINREISHGNGIVPCLWLTTYLFHFKGQKDQRDVLGEVAILIGYQEQGDDFNTVVNSDGYLRKSLLLRHPLIGFELQKNVVKFECIDNERDWCYGTDWDQEAWYAATKDAALQSIDDLTGIFSQLYPAAEDDTTPPELIAGRYWWVALGKKRRFVGRKATG